MRPERWRRLDELFEAAIELEPAARADLLASACADDPDLLRELHAILASHDLLSAPSTTNATLAVESRLGRYEIVSLLGTGGMGEVYRARDPQLGREVGIKILSARDGVTPDQLRRFEREARAVGALNHSHILTVYDIGMERGIPYVVSELLEGETLRARLDAGPLPVGQAVDFARQILSGLTAAHEKDLVHRDIKPENLFVTREGLVKILDFGLAKQTGGVGASRAEGEPPITEHGLVMGTAGYMSPEQVRGRPADARSDVFAFGAVLYEMLAGRRAFTGESVVETLNAILTTEPPPLATVVPELPASLGRFVEQCLEKDLDQRLTSARAAAAALEAAHGGGQVGTALAVRDRSGQAGTRLAVGVRSGQGQVSGSGLDRKFWLTTAAMLFIAVTVITALTLTSWGQPPKPGASGRPALAVMPLDDRSGDPNVAWLLKGVPRLLVTSLAQTPGLDVIGSERLEASFGELGRDPSDASARGPVARHAGAGAVLTGSLFKVGNDLRIDVQVEDVETGRVVAAGSEQGQDLFALVDRLTARIRTALDVKDRPAGRPLKDVTTSSLAAYELYVKGLEAWHYRRWGDARTIFDEAVRIDPAFALAHAQLAIVLERLGEAAKADVHRQQVMSLLDRLPERQRLLAEAKHESQTDLSRARAVLERLIERYPDEEEAYDLMVHTYSYTRDPAYKQTLAFMQRWARAIPGAGSGHFHNHYGYALIDHGLYTEAEREFRAYIAVSPNEANPHDSLAELFLITGRPEQAIVHYDQALRLNPLFGNSHLGRAYALAMRGRYDEAFDSLGRLEKLGQRAGLSPAAIHLTSAFLRSRVGRYRDADDQIATALRIARESGDLAGEADGHVFEALLAFERGHVARALAAVHRSRRAASRVSPDTIRGFQSFLAHLIGGTVEASAGGIEAARAHQAGQRALDTGSDEINLASQQALAGEIALAAGDLAAADTAFRAAEYKTASLSTYPALVTIANHLPFRDGLARVGVARGDLRQAIDIYRRLNQPDIATKWTSVLEPRYVLAVARLAHRTGDRATAQSEYARFLELWKDADEGLPQLAEARQYLNRLSH